MLDVEHAYPLPGTSYCLSVAADSKLQLLSIRLAPALRPQVLINNFELVYKVASTDETFSVSNSGGLHNRARFKGCQCPCISKSVFEVLGVMQL